MQIHHVMLGAFIAATLGTGYFITGHELATPAFAQEQPANEPLDLSKLVKISMPHFDVSFDQSVDLTPLTTVTVNKIAYGRPTEVQVVTTSTGTYSTDSLKSPYVLYPGVSVTERDAYAAAGNATGPYWKMRVGPAVIYTPGTPSLIHIVPVPSGGKAIITDSFSCIDKNTTVVCF